jgi:Holliday junction resolvasome RuvABC DNA-binding subunit
MADQHEKAAIRGWFLSGATIEKICDLSGINEKEIELIIADLKKYVDEGRYDNSRQGKQRRKRRALKRKS